MALMIGKDYRAINEFNNKFILSSERMVLVLDDKTKHLPARITLSILLSAIARKMQMETIISYSINLRFNVLKDRAVEFPFEIRLCRIYHLTMYIDLVYKFL